MDEQGNSESILLLRKCKADIQGDFEKQSLRREESVEENKAKESEL